MKYENPVIRGFNPDPSICRKGKDFYVVCSTFEFFPGIPVYHSRNLVDWELINHCLSDDESLPLETAWHSGGLYAPTIRYENETFYMTVTNVSGKGNLLVHTEDVRKSWSKPVYIAQDGIDPSLFFDDDGKVYFLSTGFDECQPEAKKAFIQMSRIDVKTGELLYGPVILHYGSGGRCPEAPHLYKIRGKYYLMLAEGGTEYGHMVTMFRSDSPFGEYKACPRNPILSHRDRPFSPFQCLGHADLTDDENGNWWMVCLGVRPIPGAALHNLGRETFLLPMIWGEDGFPIVGDSGEVPPACDAPLPEPPKNTSNIFLDDFSALKPEYLFCRNPVRKNYIYSNGLTLKGEGVRLIDDKSRPTFLGLRQREHEFEFQVNVKPVEGSGGITVYNNCNYHYDIVVERKESQTKVFLRKAVHDIRQSLPPVFLPGEELVLGIRGGKDYYTFFCRSGKDEILLGRGAVAGLCSEQMIYMNFTGALLGMFCEQGEISFTALKMADGKR